MGQSPAIVNAKKKIDNVNSEFIRYISEREGKDPTSGTKVPTIFSLPMQKNDE